MHPLPRASATLHDRWRASALSLAVRLLSGEEITAQPSFSPASGDQSVTLKPAMTGCFRPPAAVRHKTRPAGTEAL
jgi:hypothetical protein